MIYPLHLPLILLIAANEWLSDSIDQRECSTWNELNVRAWLKLQLKSMKWINWAQPYSNNPDSFAEAIIITYNEFAIHWKCAKLCSLRTIEARRNDRTKNRNVININHKLGRIMFVWNLWGWAWAYYFTLEHFTSWSGVTMKWSWIIIDT